MTSQDGSLLVMGKDEEGLKLKEGGSGLSVLLSGTTRVCLDVSSDGYLLKVKFRVCTFREGTTHLLG